MIKKGISIMKELKEKIKYHCPEVVEGHISGKGVVTAILDTGVTIHPDLRGRIIGWKDLVNQRPMPFVMF